MREPPGVNPQTGPPLEVLREFRFAVVMYGGVSLSIYMNGVAQELFHLVRATAPASPDQPAIVDQPAIPAALPEEQLSGSELAYRRLAQSIPMGDGRSDYGLIDPFPLGPLDEIKARFVVDVLSGSSAGGINAVFLAKALANDQELSGLTDLWLDEGDIEKLVNDASPGVGLPKERPPASLLNSSRMYLDLLQAFDRMEASRPTDATTMRSPYVDDLDLYVTTTDLRGVSLPIRFDNGVTVEPRYRNVFHFRYRWERPEVVSDFRFDSDPFLAFACRCTSAFPVAFQPMTLNDITPLVGSVQRYAGLGPTHDWTRFYTDYLPSAADGPAPGSLAFADRPFADGGALDNKPFGYAIDTLLRRQSESVPVDRKLIFIEPDPSTRTAVNESPERPDVLENLLAQTVLLPRQEVVRDDLRRIDDLNRLSRRIQEALVSVEKDLFPESPRLPPSPKAARQSTVARHGPETWRLESDESRDRCDSGYAGYLSLRRDATIERLAELFCDLLRRDATSDYAVALRALLRAWLESTFGTDPRGDRADILAFLAGFDSEYRLRRLAFVERRLDVLYRAEPTAEGATGIIDRSRLAYFPRTQEALASFRSAIQRLKAGVSIARLEIQLLDMALMKDRDQLVSRTGLTDQDLRGIYSEPTDAGRRARAREVYAQRSSTLDALMGEAVARPREAAFAKAADTIDKCMQAAGSLGTDGAVATQVFLDRYDNFERFDAVAFPIQYGSGGSEGDHIEVIRISPLDATALTPMKGSGAKVTGGRYMHFGAFLDRLWRENDIMWGRLDAAEVLIEALVPQPVVDPTDDSAVREARDYRRAYVGHLRDMAHCAILREELQRSDLAMLLSAGAHRKDRPEIDPKLASLIDTADRCSELLDRFRDNYERPNDLKAEPTYRTIGRGAHVLGQMFHEVAAKRGTKRGAWVFSLISRLGQLFTGMVEAAVPGSFMHLLWYHWFVFFYVFELLAIVGGSLFGTRAIAQFGITAFVVSVVLNLGIWFIARRIGTPNPLKVRFFALGVCLGVILAIAIMVLAAIEMLHLTGVHVHIPFYGEFPSPTPSPSP